MIRQLLWKGDPCNSIFVMVNRRTGQVRLEVAQRDEHGWHQTITTIPIEVMRKRVGRLQQALGEKCLTAGVEG